MRRLIKLVLLISALVGFAGQSFARLDLPQPEALASRIVEADAIGRGIELPSDLLGEAHMTEAQERTDYPLSILDLMAIKGWAVAALIADMPAAPVAPAPPRVRPVAAQPLFTAFSLSFDEADPPRS